MSKLLVSMAANRTARYCRDYARVESLTEAGVALVKFVQETGATQCMGVWGETQPAAEAHVYTPEQDSFSDTPAAVLISDGMVVTRIYQ